MGQIKQGILGDVSGKVGTVIGSRWKGISFIRAKAAHFSDAKTQKQLITRAVFTKLGKLAKSLFIPVIKPIWNDSAETMTGFNNFMKVNFKVVDPELSLAENEGLQLSIGDVAPVDNLKIVDNVAVPGGVTITWKDNSGYFEASTGDLLRVVAICGDQAVAITPTGATRSMETADVLLPFGSGVSVRVFVFFENTANTKFSNDKNVLVTVS